MFILISISLFQSFNPLFPLRWNSKPSTLTFSFTGLTGYKGPIRNKSYISRLLFTVFQEQGKFLGYRDFPSNCKSETLQKLSVLCLLGVRKTRTGYLRMADADLLRVIKKERKREMRMAKKKNEQIKKERNLSFKSLAVTYVWPFTYIQNKMPKVGIVTFEPCTSFHRCHGNKDAPFLLLKCTHAWYTCTLSVQPKACKQVKKQLKKIGAKVRLFSALSLLNIPPFTEASGLCNHRSEARILPDQYPNPV